MLENDKYVVFKAEDWKAWLSQSSRATVITAPSPIQDAVVIRRQDVFAAPALHAYAESISTAQTILRGTRPLVKDNPEALEKLDNEIKELIDLADFFHGQADQAHADGSKVPD